MSESHAEAVGLANAATSPDPQVGLAGVAALRRLVDHLERVQVTRARELGWSWAEIAKGLGVSRQAAFKKHGR